MKLITTTRTPPLSNLTPTPSNLIPISRMLRACGSFFVRTQKALHGVVAVQGGCYVVYLKNLVYRSIMAISSSMVRLPLPMEIFMYGPPAA